MYVFDSSKTTRTCTWMPVRLPCGHLCLDPRWGISLVPHCGWTPLFSSGTLIMSLTWTAPRCLKAALPVSNASLASRGNTSVQVVSPKSIFFFNGDGRRHRSQVLYLAFVLRLWPLEWFVSHVQSPPTAALLQDLKWKTFRHCRPSCLTCVYSVPSEPRTSNNIMWGNDQINGIGWRPVLNVFRLSLEVILGRLDHTRDPNEVVV